MDLAFRVEFKYICTILHDYRVIIGVVVGPPRGLLVFSQRRGLWTLSGAAGTFERSPRLLPSASRPPSSSSAPPPRPFSAALAGSQARVSRQAEWRLLGGCWARGAGARIPGRRLGPPSSWALPGGGRVARGAGRAAWPLLRLPSPKLRSPLGPDSLMIQRILPGRQSWGEGAGAERRGQQADAATGARAGIRATTKAAAAHRARRPLPSSRGSRCMGPGGRSCCVEPRRRRTPQAGWG